MATKSELEAEAKSVLDQMVVGDPHSTEWAELRARSLELAGAVAECEQRDKAEQIERRAEEVRHLVSQMPREELEQRFVSQDATLAYYERLISEDVDNGKAIVRASQLFARDSERRNNAARASRALASKKERSEKLVLECFSLAKSSLKAPLEDRNRWKSELYLAAYRIYLQKAQTLNREAKDADPTAKDLYTIYKQESAEYKKVPKIWPAMFKRWQVKRRQADL